MIKFKIKYVKFNLATYLSEWGGDYGTEEWAEAICPFCGEKCAVFLRDTAGKPDAVRFWSHKRFFSFQRTGKSRYQSF